MRLIIADLDPEEQLFTGEQLESFLTLAGGNIRLASADALEAIAASELLVSKKIRTQDLSTDGPAVAAELRKMAATQRELAAQELAAEDADWDGFDVVDSFSRRRPEHTNRVLDELWGL